MKPEHSVELSAADFKFKVVLLDGKAAKAEPAKQADTYVPVISMHFHDVPIFPALRHPKTWRAEPCAPGKKATKS